MADPEPVISFDEVDKSAAQDAIWAIRGLAIQQYANLEQSLCHLFAFTGGIDDAVAGIIFFRITSSQVRNQILDKLIRRRFGSAFNLFWNSYLKALRPLDIKRNEIVHWNMETHVSVDGGKFTVECTLVPPNFYTIDKNTPKLSKSDLLAFMEQCDVFSRAVNMFVASVRGILPEDVAKSWLDIFQKPLAYPLPDTHPLSRNYKAPGSPPQSSPQ